jgi:alkylhydroperoxidase/carboxymuconolactone decarboxylase family protein YurZ
MVSAPSVPSAAPFPVIHVISIYAGVPAGVECFRIAKKVFAERDMA